MKQQSDIKNRIQEYLDKGRPLPISRERFADECGVSFSTIALLLRPVPGTGCNQITRKKIADTISRLLGEEVSVSDLFYF